MNLPRVVIGMPVYGWMPAEAALSLAQVVAHAVSAKDPYVVGFEVVANTYLNLARDEIVRRALATQEATHLFFVDSDMVIPPDAPLRLHKAGSHIVSGLYFERQHPHRPVAILNGDRPSLDDVSHGWPIPVAAVGMGCTLIDLSVFRRLPEPWFEFGRQEGEDVAFCDRARKKGFTICLDTGCKCLHVTTTTVGIETAYAAVCAKRVVDGLTAHRPDDAYIVPDPYAVHSPAGKQFPPE